MHVMGIPLLRGRQFDSQDRENAPEVAIVNRRFAEEYMPNEDPVGKQIKFGLPNGPAPWITIVGIAGDVERSDFFSEMSYRIVPIIYRPATQQSGDSMSVFVRTRNDPNGLIGMMQREVQSLDARVPVHD